MVISAVLILTLMPSDDVPSVSLPHIDKVVHFLMFGAISTVIMFDLGRLRGGISFVLLAACAATSSLAGGAIEFIQGAMNNGRGCEWGDFVADTVGALLMPVLFFPVLRRAVDEYSLRLKPVGWHDKIPDSVKTLYHDAFPADERRPWDSVLELIVDEPRFHVTLIRSGRSTVGFINWWSLGEAAYIEHFAIEPRFRSKGLGADALTRFCNAHRHSVTVLEAEPEGMNEMAGRRLHFYERCGFTPHDELPYIQPPYTPESEPVELVLLTRGPVKDLETLASEIRRRVYKA